MDSSIYSDTSNILSATTLMPDSSFKVFLLKSSLTENSITINFIDSTNIEKGFKLHVKINRDEWNVIDSIEITNPLEMDTLQFEIFPENGDTWYTFKIEAYNNSSTVFSPESTIFFKGPKQDFQYYFSKIASIPAKPISWIEKVGDSLYFQETPIENDTQIAIINISNDSTLIFDGYLNTETIPEHLQNTPLGVRLGDSPCKDFVKSINGNYFCFKDSSLYQYDSISLNFIDSINFSFLLENAWEDIGYVESIYSINDSMIQFSLNTIENNTPNSSPYESFVIKVSNSGIDTLLKLISDNILKSSGAGAPSYYRKLMVKNNSIVYLMGSGRMGYVDNTYSYFSFVDNFNIAPLKYTYITEDNPFVGYTNGSHICNFEGDFIIKKVDKKFYISDFTDPLQNVNNNYGYFPDSLLSYSIKASVLDSVNNRIFFFHDDKITLMSYEKGEVDIEKSHSIINDNKSSNIRIKTLSTVINFNFSQPINGIISIYNASGKKIFNSTITNQKAFKWNKKSNSNENISSGFYIVKLKDKSFQISKPLLITN